MKVQHSSRWNAILIAGLFVMSSGGSHAQQTEPPASLKWTPDQIKAAVATARAGRDLTPKHWPHGAKVAVCLSFDVDNDTTMLLTKNPGISPMSDGEFGAKQGLPRILAMLEREKVPATFYMPAASAIIAPELVTEINKSGRNEIALHGWIHEAVVPLNSYSEEYRLLKQASDYYTKVTGKRPVGSRTGAWAVSPYTIQVEQKLGLLYDSSMMAMEEPYEIMSNGKDTGLVELPVSWVLDDYPALFMPGGTLPSPQATFQVWKDDFDMAYQEGGMVMLTFHPHISGRRSRMVYLAKLVQYMKTKQNVWFATSQEVAEYVKNPK
jgi:peptidoglycan/xylan/chitin deacetylase (PgdA/CDA1 family)